LNQHGDAALNHHKKKITVLSWLLLALAGTVSTLLSIINNHFQLVFALSTVISWVLLSWLWSDKKLYQQPFYRWSWYLTCLLFLITVAAVLYQFWAGGGL